jgi:hypothetical protein
VGAFGFVFEIGGSHTLFQLRWPGIVTPTGLPYHLGTHVLHLAVHRVAGRFLRLKLVSESIKQFKKKNEYFYWSQN